MSVSCYQQQIHMKQTPNTTGIWGHISCKMIKRCTILSKVIHKMIVNMSSKLNVFLASDTLYIKFDNANVHVHISPGVCLTLKFCFIHTGIILKISWKYCCQENCCIFLDSMFIFQAAWSSFYHVWIWKRNQNQIKKSVKIKEMST